ncbi:MAG: ATP-binding cassette domain-containing protein [Desulfocapsa sp.]|uniref:ATP-binding cassette domain-containing protein n=1 Tax=Desulfotalea psychrophila TaxID=84980 RepID=A0ABS3ATM3_9BACT|nr:ATP-binding cassette domain-containing protein [Desulfocapsa sp.]MBN4068451.1 ATP-binding cassette domain-containing protein [Desulfotalea psychrophila]
MEGLSLVNLSFLENGPYSLTIEAGECIGLTGKSGVGKSQLLRAVADVIVHGGDCYLNGRSCLDMSPPKWRSMVAMVPAESFWWYDTVGSHFDPELERVDSVELLEKLGFTSDVMNWQVSRLSTGERQRLALVRTLVTGPKVLLLDEPTSSLDKKMVDVVEQLLADICSLRRTACLWVGHDLEQLFRVASRVFRLEQNGLTEEAC